MYLTNVIIKKNLIHSLEFRFLIYEFAIHTELTYLIALLCYCIPHLNIECLPRIYV